MVYTQIDVPEEVNEKLKIVKIKRKDNTIQDTILYILKKYTLLEDEKIGH